jgi:LuxR family maltose regulon positive regulatory protein
VHRRVTDAARVLEELRDATTHHGGLLSLRLGVLIMLASIRKSQERHDQAFALLAEALRLAEPGGFIRPFVEGGPALLPLLKTVAADNVAGYAQQVIKALNASLPTPEQPSGVSALSEREREVLRLIASGLKNQQIAHQLVISLNTVLYHTKNIYSKLGVTHRTQAVQHARELGVL